MKEIVRTLLIVAGLGVAASQEYGGRHALFVRAPSVAGKRGRWDSNRISSMTMNTIHLIDRE